jgi:hypothetical protein
MEEIGVAWLYPIIIVAGALQAWGPPMNEHFATPSRTLGSPAWYPSFPSSPPDLFVPMRATAAPDR